MDICKIHFPLAPYANFWWQVCLVCFGSAVHCLDFWSKRTRISGFDRKLGNVSRFVNVCLKVLNHLLKFSCVKLWSLLDWCRSLNWDQLVNPPTWVSNVYVVSVVSKCWRWAWLSFPSLPFTTIFNCNFTSCKEYCYETVTWRGRSMHKCKTFECLAVRSAGSWQELHIQSWRCLIMLAMRAEANTWRFFHWIPLHKKPVTSGPWLHFRFPPC